MRFAIINGKISLALILLSLLFSCNYQKWYADRDYPFHDQRFVLADTSLLRVDGVYISANKIYKFYSSGQVNMILDIEGKFHTPDAYRNAFNEHVLEARRKKKATLFEGYYRLQGTHLVIQQMASPRKQFTYTYALLEKNQLIIQQTTHIGKGKFNNKYFSIGSNTPYTFIPTKGNYLAPNW